ncbi:MAG: polysaccharide deacetylase family protein [candidate division Zixibacteria bacterium]|nr:polysaccharide deacetylase family protein [candidate division Zixibacteria bacterium]
MIRLKTLFKFIALYASGLWLLFRKANRRRLLILMYHGVVPEDINIWTQVPAIEFDRQMKYISEKYNVVSLEDAVGMISGEKSMPDYPAVITFDDGFNNNKTYAYPILKKYNLPATIFLSTSIIDETNDYQGLLWPDYITCLFRSTRKSNIDLSDIGMTKFMLDSDNAKDMAIDEICGNLKKLSNNDKLEVINKITECAEVDKLVDSCQLYKGLGWDDVQEMDVEGLVNFGAHTVTHPILSKINNDEVEKEILDSQQIIGQRLGKRITTFAYPNGKKQDYNDFAKQIVSENFICSPSTSEGLVNIGDDLYELKRVGPGNKTSLWEFKLLISRTISIYYKLIGKKV